MEWYFVNNKTHHQQKVEYSGIHEDDWRNGYYILKYTDKLNFRCEHHFTSHQLFVEWQLAAERKATWFADL
jgi:hypothetical protein